VAQISLLSLIASFFIKQYQYKWYIQCSGSVTFWYGYGSVDPYLLLTDPAFFTSDGKATVKPGGTAGEGATVKHASPDVYQKDEYLIPAGPYYM
jgi:hypothetical protein